MREKEKKKERVKKEKEERKEERFLGLKNISEPTMILGLVKLGESEGE